MLKIKKLVFRFLSFWNLVYFCLLRSFIIFRILALEKRTLKKRKIINDPVHGFISVSSDLLFDLIQHPWFQRLRRIKQLGLTSLVYPGATHTRFQHALGAFHLTGMAVAVIRSKGHQITEEEGEAVQAAVLLHDVGHGPFSHALESSIIPGISHEDLSLQLMKSLNEEFEGRLSMAIDIFTDRYPKKCLHQLVAGQLDMDRLDYLKRDTYFTGVTEGMVGSDRIIKMLNVINDQLVVESKGIYSIEKFLVARRLMYWQVYFHKTVVAAEFLLVNMLKRAKQLFQNGTPLFASPPMIFFLKQNLSMNDPESFFRSDLGAEMIHSFTSLDDSDVYACAKVWATHADRALSMLASSFISRKLFNIEIQKQAFSEERVGHLRKTFSEMQELDAEVSHLFIFTGEITNFAYNTDDERIQILHGNGTLEDVSEASDMLNISVLSKVVRKYFLCFPKELKEYY